MIPVVETFRLSGGAGGEVTGAEGGTEPGDEACAMGGGIGSGGGAEADADGD
jgi:hypothetical protein